MDRLTAVVGFPAFLAVVSGIIAVWICANVLLGLDGLRAFDPPPFFWLQAALAGGALYVTALILSTQRRRDQLDSHRDQLLLELAILNDRKVSKLVELLEEMRRDDPALVDRCDHLAHAMSTPSDSSSMLDAVKSGKGDTVPGPSAPS